MVNKSVKAFVFISVAIASSVILVMLQTTDSIEAKIIQVGKNQLTVEIAETFVMQSRGLSNRDALLQDHGMLFVYPDKKIRNFWMKDMLFPLDVLWIADGIVVGTQENIPYELSGGEVVRFKSNIPTDTVLEVNAGWIAEHGIQTGDVVSLDTSAN